MNTFTEEKKTEYILQGCLKFDTSIKIKKNLFLLSLFFSEGHLTWFSLIHIIVDLFCLKLAEPSVGSSPRFSHIFSPGQKEHGM